MTKGVGLLIGPLAVGAVIDIFQGQLEATDGYAAMWPAVGIPVLLVTPLVYLLSQAESGQVRRREETPVG
jgi:hypothetical protein